MFLRSILLSVALVGALWSNLGASKKLTGHVGAKQDTLKRNDFIVYNVTKDTLVAGAKLSVQNQNIAGQYIIQYFNLDEHTVIANYYPEMLGNIKIRKDGKLWFDQTFLKKDLPESPLDRYKSKAVIKELNFWEYIPEEKVFVFKAIAHVPNTDFVYDFHIRVLPNGKYTIRHIGEAGD